MSGVLALLLLTAGSNPPPEAPQVVHVVVALCDNDHQGIVPVPRRLGNGQDPASNLYWGARYGVRTYLTRDGGWTRVASVGLTPPGVLERLVVRTIVSRDTGPVTVWLVADAWDGRRIREAIAWFLDATAGRNGDDRVTVTTERGPLDLPLAGAATLVAFVGHNGLMDFEPPAVGAGRGQARPVLVLACSSQRYFLRLLEDAGATPVLLTTGLLAPEAYVLDAAVRAWFGTGRATDAREAAARAYHRFQRCGLRAARRLFDAQE